MSNIWKLVNANVHVKGNDFVITGIPIEDSEHNCDHMGCNSMDHVLYRGVLEKGNEFEEGESHE